MQQHIHSMRHALTLARRGLGQVWPNPTVGAVIVKDGPVIGRGWTGKGGRPHAETIALEQAGENARGATMYVSLEPCAHHGKTPPCTEAIIKAGTKTVVVACTDPDPRVSGKGIAMLKAAGIEVIENICRQEAEALNTGFFTRIRTGLPLVNMKIASSADGKISGGKNRWITGEQARAYGHLLRSQHDAVLTGIGTVLADDPLLTCRLPGMENHSPLRIILDSHLRLPATSKIAQMAKEIPTWVVTRQKNDSATALEKLGLRVLTVPAVADGNIDIRAALKLLGDEGLTRILVEAGQGLSTAFMQAGLVRTLYWFESPTAIGAKGLTAFSEAGCYPAALPTEQFPLGPDRLRVYAPLDS